MAGLSVSDLQDLQKTTLQDLPKLDFEVPLARQNYVFCDQMLSGKKGRIEIQSGHEISRRTMLSQSGNAEHVNLYQSTEVNVADVLSEISEYSL